MCKIKQNYITTRITQTKTCSHFNITPVKKQFYKKTEPKTQKKLCTPRHFRTSASGMHNTHFYSGTISVADIFTII